MKIGIYPMYSQQDKASKQFLLSTCGGTQMYCFLAKKLREEFDAEVLLGVPQDRDMTPSGCKTVDVYCPPDNVENRVHWDVRDLKRIFADADLCIVGHNTASIAVRRLFPDKRIVYSMLTTPNDPLFYEACESSDIVAVQSPNCARSLGIAQKARDDKPSRIEVWQMAFDAGNVRYSANRDIDVLFLHRASKTNYTHHLEFLKAHQKYLQHLNVVYTDPTKYMACEGLEVKRMDCDFREALSRTRVAVSFHDSWYGSLSIREACHARCVPVVNKNPAYTDIVGENWEYTCDVDSPYAIAETVKKALDHYPLQTYQTPYKLSQGYSFQAAWRKVKSDIVSLL